MTVQDKTRLIGWLSTLFSPVGGGKATAGWVLIKLLICSVRGYVCGGGAPEL